MKRRDVLKGSAQIAALAAVAPTFALAAVPARPRRIATEEAFATPELIAEYRRLAQSPSENLDMQVLIEPFYSKPSPLVDKLLDIGEGRIKSMDEAGVDMQILSLTSPGVQSSPPDRAFAIAVSSNDRLAEAITRYPTRFAGLAAMAPQAPAQSVREMERAINKLKLNGFIINSHTNNRYLDDPFFWPILEAAEALDRPIYLHPRMPSDGMAGPFRGLPMTTWSFGMETSTHVVRMMFAGVFDRFPKLQIVLGHMGEAVHFWQTRLDKMASDKLTPNHPNLKTPPSEILKRNFSITTSGQRNNHALQYSFDTLGPDHVMWAIDYPWEDQPINVEFLERAPIPAEVKAMIFGGNAERIFHLV